MRAIQWIAALFNRAKPYSVFVGHCPDFDCTDHIKISGQGLTVRKIVNKGEATEQLVNLVIGFYEESLFRFRTDIKNSSDGVFITLE